jgi:AraC-like DNA-binding protein
MKGANNNWEEKREEVKRLKAERALQILADQIENIRYVKDWASEVGCTETTLTRLCKCYFNTNSKQVLKKVRYRKICKLIESNPEITSYAVAQSSGLHNEQNLFKFLKRHFDTTYSEIRYEVLIQQLSELNGNHKTDSLIQEWLE